MALGCSAPHEVLDNATTTKLMTLANTLHLLIKGLIARHSKRWILASYCTCQGYAEANASSMTLRWVSENCNSLCSWSMEHASRK